MGPLTSKLPEIPAEPVNGNPEPSAFKAYEAVKAKDEVPSKLPVNPPLALTTPDAVTFVSKNVPPTVESPISA